MSRTRLGRYLFGYSMLAIPFAFFLVFRIVPIIRTLTLSVFQWDLISREKPFVGIENFRALWQDASFKLAFSNTTVLAVVTVTCSVVLGLVIALPLARRLRFGGVYQLLLFLPFITPMVPSAVAWRWIYETRYGMLNYVLSLVGAGPVPWLSNPSATLWAVIIMSVWKTLGYNTLLFVVGLRAIPGEYGEAAQLDGASGWQYFWFVTLPLLMPTVLLVVVISTINSYNAFTQVYVLAADVQGSPGSLARVLIYDIFEKAFRFYRMGYASAEAAVFLLIVLCLTALQFRVLGARTD
ncbi:MAG TPA: sugar ABC transporter permease [Nitrospiraceae bacterium]|nr:sugar ABC transporter permease [Nitrospiraceae bacterium]